jgi:glutaredoxin
MKNFFKKVFATLLLSISLLALLVNSLDFQVKANEQNSTIHIFSSKFCPHCRDAENFLRELQAEQDHLKIYQYEVSYQQNSQLLSLLASKLDVSSQGVPFILINNQAIIGFSDATPTQIYTLLDAAIDGESIVTTVIRDKQLTPIVKELGVDESVTNLPSEDLGANEENEENEKNEENEEIDLPLFGKVQLQEVSLPLLTIMIAFLDGFNPCAMWVLIFLISLLLGMNDRRRMWILGSVFILTSGFVYFLFMTAWLNFFIFIGLVNWIRIAIAVLAVFVAVHYLRDFVKNKDGACQVDLGGNKQKIFARLKEVVYRKNLLWSLLGIILLAFSVNLLELVCSAGLPAVYTKVLSMSELNSAQYYIYLLIYIVVFMLDDMAVFAITMISMKKVIINTKYARYSHLIGGIIMLIIGLLMFFKPEWIMFG